MERVTLTSGKFTESEEQGEKKTYTSIEILKANHQCSQINCQAYKSSSSDSDIEHRIKTKATRFFKAYPKAKGNISDHRVVSSDSEEAKPLIHTQLFNESVSKEGAALSKDSCYTGTNILLSSDSELEEVQTSTDDRFFEKCHKYVHKKYSRDASQKTTGIKQKLGFPKLICIELSSNSSSEDSSETKSVEIVDPLKLDNNNRESSSGQNTNQCKTHEAIIVDDEASSIKKPTRPFRTYAVDPSEVIAGVDTAKLNVSEGTPESYIEFRTRMLGRRRATKSEINRNMRRQQTSQAGDNFYTEKRKRNNLASKKSRDARRAKEDELAIRCAYLEQENMFLKRQIAEIEQEKRRLNATSQTTHQQ